MNRFPASQAATNSADEVSAIGDPERALALLAQGQGAFYLLSGLWPLLSPGSFQAVTGPKEDFWLAQTVGLLLVVVGTVLLLAGRSRRITREIVLLAAGSALVLGMVDVFCVFAPRTTRAYWLDAVVEFAIAGAWGVLVVKRRHEKKRRHNAGPGSAPYS